MTRTRRTTETSIDGQLILPRELAEFVGAGAVAYAVFCRERSQWLREHGIDPGDWPRVHAVLLASWSAYGIPGGALERHRLACERRAGRAAS